MWSFSFQILCCCCCCCCCFNHISKKNYSKTVVWPWLAFKSSSSLFIIFFLWIKIQKKKKVKNDFVVFFLKKNKKLRKINKIQSIYYLAKSASRFSSSAFRRASARFSISGTYSFYLFQKKKDIRLMFFA